MNSKERVRACVPHTPYTSILKFVPSAGRGCGAATHAVGGDTGYGLLYEAGRTNNRLASIWDAMPMTAGKVKLNQPFDASSLLPRNLRYYRFAGSLTTPPCTEGVSWLVLKSYDHIDQAQAEKFTRAIGSHNSRPVQPLNARVIIE